MKQELKSGIPEFDNAVEQFENGEINFLELTCRLWNTAYAMGKSEQLNLPHVSNRRELLIAFMEYYDNKYDEHTYTEENEYFIDNFLKSNL